jgi:hypothetical protein
MRVGGSLLIALMLTSVPAPCAASDLGRAVLQGLAEGLMQGLDQDTYSRYKEDQYRQELLDLERQRLYQEQLQTYYEQQRLYQQYRQQRPLRCFTQGYGTWAQTICR